MKIPEKITIAGIEYKINQCEQNSSKLGYDGFNGLCVYDSLCINLNKDQKPQGLEVTLIHELVHAALHTLNLNHEEVKLDERFVESFAQLWYQIIKQL